VSFAYIDLPAYLKRDLRRTVGEHVEVYPFHGFNAMRMAIESTIATEGKAAMVDGWGLRRAAKDSSVRRAAAAICHGKQWDFVYSRRGDLCFFLPAAQ
jgi:hypothetical protein